jgi:hypothetical protein
VSPFIYIAASLVGLLAVWSAWQAYSLRVRFDRALSTADGDSLESTLTRVFSGVTKVDKKLDQLTSAHRQLAAMTALASQKISVVRFNPFGDTGGDQSFALAVLDGHDSGYVITSIHGRGGTRVYVKPIDYGKSKYKLSSEEQQALNQATKRVPKEE